MTPFLPKRLPIRPRDRVLEIGFGGRPLDELAALGVGAQVKTVEVE